MFSVVDDILNAAMKIHTLENVYDIGEQYKLKPIRVKKDFSKMHETNLMDNHTMRKIQMV